MFNRSQNLTICIIALLAAAAVAPSAQAQKTQKLPAKLGGGTEAQKRTFDVFAGRNNKGPYTLSWAKLPSRFAVASDRPLVVVDGVMLSANAFSLNWEKGTISFSRDLKSTQVARVSYAYDALTSLRNNNPASAPLTVSLLQLGDTRFQVTALPTMGDNKSAGLSSGETPLVWSMGRTSRFLGGGFSSDIHYSGETGAGLKLGYQTGREQGSNLTANFQRAGKEFATRTGKAFGMESPAQNWKIGANLRPTQWMGLFYTASDNRDLTGKGDTGQNVMGFRLGGATVGRDVPLIAWSHTTGEATTGKPGEVGTASTINALEVTSAAFGVAQVAAKSTQTETDAPGTKSDETSSEKTLAVNAASPDKKKQASLQLTDATKQTPTTTEDKQNFAVKLQPAPVLALSAEQKAQKTEPVVAPPAEGDKKAAEKTPTVETVTQTATAEIMPMPGTKITGSVSLAETQSDVAGDKNDPSKLKSAATDIGAQIGGGKAIELTGGRINRSTDDPNGTTLDTTRAGVALRPFGSGLTLSGGYTVNPDKDSKAVEGDRQEFGVKAKLGALELGSGYALTTLTNLSSAPTKANPQGASLDDAQYGEVSVTLGLRFSRTTSLAGKYRDAILYGSAVDQPALVGGRGSRVYGLDFKHEVGSDVSFLLGGLVVNDKTQTGKPADIKGEAKLGVKF